MHNSTRNYVKKQLVKLIEDSDATIETLKEQCDITDEDIDSIIEEIRNDVETVL